MVVNKFLSLKVILSSVFSSTIDIFSKEVNSKIIYFIKSIDLIDK